MVDLDADPGRAQPDGDLFGDGDQEVLADPKWADKLTDADRRALSPLFWTHVNPYGRFELDMNSRLDLELAAAMTVPGPRGPQSEASTTR
ncbi:hypothetical protein ABZ260_28640 [Streptosporangium sp. NPDC006013]|uniref:hypothetical protein n=1 Tax=Streptosporangium sp. NPDC006013 TaxID=3155596 RepID=UPI00339E408B